MEERKQMRRGLKLNIRRVAIAMIMILVGAIFIGHIFNRQFHNVILTISAGLIFCAITIYSFKDYIYKRVILYKKLIDEGTPIPCEVESIINLTHTSKRDIVSYPFVVLKSLEDEKLYFTYGHLMIDTTGQYTSHKIGDVTYVEYKKPDGTCLKNGDKADMYIKSIDNIAISIDEKEETIKLNSNEFDYTLASDGFKIESLKDAVFFCGVIDVKPENEE